MIKAKLIKINEKVENAVSGAYKKLEGGVTSAYKKLENGVTGAYTSIEDKFVGSFLTKDGETVEEAKKRLSDTQTK